MTSKHSLHASEFGEYQRRLMIENRLNRALDDLVCLQSIGSSDSRVENAIDEEIDMLKAVIRLMKGDSSELKRRVSNLRQIWNEAEYSQGTLIG